MWHQHMHPTAFVQWRAGLQAFIDKHGTTVTYGTACSGSEIFTHVQRAVSSTWASIFGMSVSFKNTFCCEQNTDKQQFIKTQHPEVPMMIATLADLAGDMALNLLSNEEELIPWVMLFVCGFPCTSRTPLSSQAKLHKHCCQSESGATGSGLAQIKDYIRKNMPLIVILENIPALLETDGDGTMSDAVFIVKQFSELGYASTYFRFDCEEWGSIARRDRLYFVFLLNHSSIAPHGDVDFSVARDLLNSMKIGPMEPDSFLSLDCSKDMATLQSIGMPPNGDSHPKKKPKSDCAYKDEHFQVFQMFGIEWPPSKFPAHINTASLSPRQAECVLAIDKHFDPSGALVEFVDVNPTISRILGLSSNKEGKDVRNPWSATCPTLTAQGKIVIRYTDTSTNKLVIRALQPYEVMAIIGWDPAFWKVGEVASQFMDGELCSSLAGNAFSAFAVGPVLSVALSTMGSLEAARAADVAEAAVSESEECQSSCSESPS